MFSLAILEQMFYTKNISEQMCSFMKGERFMKVIDENKVSHVLDFIKTFQVREGRSPSYRQIAHAARFPSLATAQKYVKILQTRGLIERNDLGRIVTPTRLETGNTIVAPLVGQVACGKPILAEENIEGTFALPTQIFGNEKVKEDQMLLEKKQREEILDQRTDNFVADMNDDEFDDILTKLLEERKARKKKRESDMEM